MTNPRKSGATITDIAQFCDVAISTVSIALRGDPRVKPATAKRIQNAAIELGYDPAVHDAARRLLSRHRNQHILNQIVALALPSNFHHTLFFNTMTWGIMDVLNQNDFALLNAQIFADYSLTTLSDPIPPIFRRGEIDGLIVFAGQDIVDSIDQLRQLPGYGDRPIISLIHSIPGLICILANEEEGGYQSAKHLLDSGHQNIAHFIHEVIFQGAKPADNLYKRLTGVKRALIEYGLDPIKNLTLLPVPGRWADPNGLPSADDNIQSHQIIQQLREHPEITGILALNDAVAINLWYQLRRAGINVPEDISIIGFDDTTPMLNHLGQNILTTVRLPLREIGQVAAQKLVACIRNDTNIDQNEQVSLPVELIIRKSTAPPLQQKR